MRIIAGKYRGRRLLEPKDRAVRPTTDRVREAVFSALEARVDFSETAVLDAFAGTGALGLEALSRGGAAVTFMDTAPASLKLVKENIAALKAEGADVRRADALKPGYNAGTAYGLLFLDPPYGKGLVRPALEALWENDWLTDGVLVMIETDRRDSVDLPADFEAISEKTYGDTKIILAQRA